MREFVPEVEQLAPLVQKYGPRLPFGDGFVALLPIRVGDHEVDGGDDEVEVSVARLHFSNEPGTVRAQTATLRAPGVPKMGPCVIGTVSARTSCLAR